MTCPRDICIVYESRQLVWSGHSLRQAQGKLCPLPLTLMLISQVACMDRCRNVEERRFSAALSVDIGKRLSAADTFSCIIAAREFRLGYWPSIGISFKAKWLGLRISAVY